MMPFDAPHFLVLCPTELPPTCSWLLFSFLFLVRFPSSHSEAHFPLLTPPQCLFLAARCSVVDCRFPAFPISNLPYLVDNPSCSSFLFFDFLFLLFKELTSSLYCSAGESHFFSPPSPFSQFSPVSPCLMTDAVRHFSHSLDSFQARIASKLGASLLNPLQIKSPIGTLLFPFGAFLAD